VVEAKVEETQMIRRLLLLLTIAAVYVAFQRSRNNTRQRADDHAAEAEWANEGGANAPSSV
jgi:hypothetical protein